MACGVCGSAGHNRRTHAEHEEPQRDALLEALADPPEGFVSLNGKPGYVLGSDAEYEMTGQRTSSVVGDEEDPPTSHGPDAGQSVDLLGALQASITRARAESKAKLCHHKICDHVDEAACGGECDEVDAWIPNPDLNPVPPWRTVLGPDEPIRITQPGCYEISSAEYHDVRVTGDWLSNSDAKQLVSPGVPAQFIYDREHGIKKTSEAFSLGTAVHTRVLGKGDEIAVRPAEWENWRTKASQEWRAEQEAAGRVVILPEQWDIVEGMAASVRDHPWAASLLDQPGRPEVAMFWIDAETGVKRRALVDYLPSTPNAQGILMPVDYKTAESVSPDEDMSRNIFKFGYFRQAATIIDGIAALGLADDAEFYFVMQSKKAPYLVTVVQLDTRAQHIGRIINREALMVYKKCLETGVWPNYSDEPVLMALPAWVENQYDEEIS